MTRNRQSYDAREHDRRRRTNDLGPLFAEDRTMHIAPAARDSDPITSHAAADDMKAHASVQRRAIVVLLERYPDGLIADQIDALCDWRETTAGRRLIELLRLGTVERTTDTRLTRSGRPAFVHRLRAGRGEGAK